MPVSSTGVEVELAMDLQMGGSHVGLWRTLIRLAPVVGSCPVDKFDSILTLVARKGAQVVDWSNS